jgi:ribosomal protein L11 methyltransferase
MIEEMFSLEIECRPEERDLLIADLWELGCEGIVELDDRRVRAFFENWANVEKLKARYPGASQRQEEEQRDWVQTARDLLQPIAVGERFFLAPEWRDDPTPAGRFRITVNPGMAFGTGAHETTQLALEALERYVACGHGGAPSVFDVGTGSGILARAARLLGAGRVYACDIDPVAVEIAGGASRGTTFVGSVDALRSGAVNLVVANISPEAIIKLAPELMRVLRPRGVLLATGFELSEVEWVRNALPPACEVRTKGNWALLVVEKAPVAPAP